MATSKISITRALAELKTLGDRIERATKNRFVALSVKGKIDNTKSVEDFSKEATASLQQYKDLVARRNALKCAIVRSNADTEVKIGEDTYTVAEAIERKNSIQYERMFVQEVSSQLLSTTAKINKNNEHANVTLNSLLAQALSNGERKMSEGDIEAISGPFRENNFASLVDPLSVEKLIAKMRDDIEQFELNVDFALSEINAVTQIEV